MLVRIAPESKVGSMSPQPGKPVPAFSTVSRPGERPTRAITKTEVLTDSVRIYFSCRRPWGSDDERSVVELPYAALHDLPVLSADHGHGEFRETWEEFVYIRTPDVTPNVTIVFRFAKWQETDDCRMEALVGGPYLAKAGVPVSVAAD